MDDNQNPELEATGIKLITQQIPKQVVPTSTPRIRASLSTRVTELVLAPSRYENQFLSLSYTVNAALLVLLIFLNDQFDLVIQVVGNDSKGIVKTPFCDK